MSFWCFVLTWEDRFEGWWYNGDEYKHGKNAIALTGSDSSSRILYMDFNIISIVSFANRNLTSRSPIPGWASLWSWKKHSRTSEWCCKNQQFISYASKKHTCKFITAAGSVCSPLWFAMFQVIDFRRGKMN